jgi:hypothetical protein
LFALGERVVTGHGEAGQTLQAKPVPVAVFWPSRNPRIYHLTCLGSLAGQKAVRLVIKLHLFQSRPAKNLEVLDDRPYQHAHSTKHACNGGSGARVSK